MKTPDKHFAAIKRGQVSKTQVIGLRKAFNAGALLEKGLSTSVTAPKISADHLDKFATELRRNEPRITGELHTSGVNLLKSPRHKKRLAAVASIVATVKEFRLTGFSWINDFQVTPIFRAVGKDGSFLFRNPSWQSGGKGPEIISISK